MIQSNYCSMTYAQRKAMYDRMYDEEGNMKITKGDVQIKDVTGWDGNQPSQLQGYAVERVGDDYVMFAMNPSIYFGGGKELTADQLGYLREKYDMYNLSYEDRIKLLAELSCLGVISGSDAYAEAFPEKCSWLQGQQRQLGIDSDKMDLSDWIEYYQQRAIQALANMNSRIAVANSFSTVACVESERTTNIFYSTLAHIMNQIAPK